jgi:SOS-response transcriptional repressor LexA
MTRPLLEPRQAALLRFVRQFVQTHGTFPTTEAISDHVGIFSSIGIQLRLRALERRELIPRSMPVAEQEAVLASA